MTADWERATTAPTSICDAGFARLVKRAGRETWIRNIYAAFDVRGPLDARALAQALTDLNERHPSLRSRLGEVDGKFVKRVAPPYAVDVGEEPAGTGDIAAVLRSAICADVEEPRTTLFRVAPEHAVLLFLMPHSCFDAGSHPIFQRELRVAYGARRGGGHPSFEAITADTTDFAAWQTQLARDATDRLTAFWQGQVEGLSAGAPALLRKDSAGTRGRQAMLPFSLTGERFATIRSRLAKKGSSLLVAATAALAALVFSRGGECGGFGFMHNLRAQFDVQNRASRKSVANVIGNFSDVLPFGVPRAATSTSAALLQRTKQYLNEASAHAGLPVMGLLGKKGEAAVRSLQSLMLSMALNYVRNRERFELEGAAVERIPRESLESGAWLPIFALEWRMAESSDALSGHLIVDSNAVSAPETAALMADYLALLERLALEDDVPIDQLGARAEGR